MREVMIEFKSPDQALPITPYDFLLVILVLLLVLQTISLHF